MNFKKYRIAEIGQIISGATPKTSEECNFGGDIAWITPADLSTHTGKYISMGKRNITQAGYDSCSTRLMPAGSVLFSSRAPIGYVAIAQNPLCTNQGFKSIIPNAFVNSEYLYYQLKFLKTEIQKLGSGTTFKELSAKKFANIEVIIPPIEEQKRIVSRIEELFSQLDNGIETLQKTKQKLEVYRQVVLRKAFSACDGENTHIRDVCNDIKVGIVIKPTQYYVKENGIRAFRNANVRPGYVEDSDWVMISQDGHLSNRRSEVHTGDVLISRSGANLGMATAISEKYNGYNAIDVVIAVPNQDKVLPEFLAAYTNSPEGQVIVKENERGAAQGHLNVTAYGKLNIKIPSLEKQRQIMEEIEEKISICREIENTIELSLKKSDALRQSILKKAFEG